MMITSKWAATARMHKQCMKLTGNQFEITVVGRCAACAEERIGAAAAEIQRTKRLLATFSEDSETNKINRAAGIGPVTVSEERFRLIQGSAWISDITQGAFDITYGSLDKSLWNFDTGMKQLPGEKTAKRMVRLINCKNILPDENKMTVYLKEKGMRIGFGGIGKGCAAERAKMILKDMGVYKGIVNASGDFTNRGQQPDGKPLTIGIVNPNFSGKSFSYLSVTGMAVATSGNYEKFILIKGKKYSHTINPHTGLPVRGIKSVTIITPNAEIADAMAAPVTIIGIRAGLGMIKKVKNMEAIVIDGNDIIYTTKNLHFT